MTETEREGECVKEKVRERNPVIQPELSVAEFKARARVTGRGSDDDDDDNEEGGGWQSRVLEDKDRASERGARTCRL